MNPTNCILWIVFIIVMFAIATPAHSATRYFATYGHSFAYRNGYWCEGKQGYTLIPPMNGVCEGYAVDIERSTNKQWVHRNNYGVGGQTSAEILARLPSVLKHSKGRTELILLEIGSNDVANICTYSVWRTVTDSIKLIIKSFKAQGQKVLVFKVAPRTAGVKCPQSMVDYNIRYINTYIANIPEGVDVRPHTTHFTSDGIHLSYLGGKLYMLKALPKLPK